MELLVNDLSLHGQYADVQAFENSIDCLMKMKAVAHRFGRDISCHRNIASAKVIQNQLMHQVIQRFDQNKKRSIMLWLTKTGPFWEDIREHSSEDYLVCKGDIVTDSAIGEVGWCCMNGIDRKLVSFCHSNWELSPVSVDLFTDDTKKTVDVENFYDPQILENALEKIPAPLDSWAQLHANAKSLFLQLFFHDDAFKPLEGHPFVSGTAQGLMGMFSKLNHFKSCHDEQGKRTVEGHEMYKNFFTGKKGGGGKGSLFKDSSDSEKIEFKNKMTFNHPERHGDMLFCPWHGSTQTPQLRVHFSWPVVADEPIYIVHVGPKITKR